MFLMNETTTGKHADYILQQLDSCGVIFQGTE